MTRHLDSTDDQAWSIRKYGGGINIEFTSLEKKNGIVFERQEVGFSYLIVYHVSALERGRRRKHIESSIRQGEYSSELLVFWDGLSKNRVVLKHWLIEHKRLLGACFSTNSDVHNARERIG